MAVRATVPEKVLTSLQELLLAIPASSERAHPDPIIHVEELTKIAAWKTAAISGALAIPPGPVGMLTILPDLMAIWRIQAQLVADIAATFGKTAYLGPEQMLYCLFRHAASHAVRDLVVRVGTRVLVRRASLQFMRRALQSIGLRVGQRLLQRSISRWVPLIGAAGVGAYAYYDTKKVGETALSLFQNDIIIEEKVLDTAVALGNGDV